jgi:predicted DNA-binding transcriptional regulator AlpA
MTKRQNTEPAPVDPIVTVEYLLGLMGWQSRSTYYNRLKAGDPDLPRLIHTGKRKVGLLKSACDRYQRLAIGRANADEGGAPAASGNNSSPAGAPA